MFVKICGITNRDDAFAAIEAGAGALGFIFYSRSPRSVTADRVVKWVDQIPPDVLRVGVFVDEQPDTIEALASQLKLDVAQLHGAETPDRHPAGLRIWKAFRISTDTLADPAYPAEALLLDGPGSGRVFDWRVAGQSRRPVVLAGGLTPENVRQAVEAVSPWGVDTASGVEASPGRKDHVRMKMFIRAALRQ